MSGRSGLSHLLACAVLAAALSGAAAQPVSPDYERKLLRLSEILGAVHYLERLCGGENEQLWRNQMIRLLNAEAPRAARRARLVNRFNRGYRGYQQAFSDCGPSANVAKQRFTREGAFLAQSLARERSE